MNGIFVQIKTAWWVKPYIKALAFFCYFHDCEPDYDKVYKFIVKYGVKIGKPN